MDEEYRLEMDRVFQTFSARHLELVHRETASLDAMEQKEAFDKLVNERKFCLRLNVDYSFYRYVHGRLREQPWMEGHFDSLSLLILLGLTHPDQVTLSDVETFWQGERLKGYKDNGRSRPEVPSERHTRRLFSEYYPEIFFTNTGEVEDNRQTPLRTLFDLDEFVLSPGATKLGKRVEEREVEFILGMYGPPTTAAVKLERHYRTCGSQRLADPGDLEGLERQGGRLLQLYLTLSDRFGDPPQEFRWLKGRMRKGDRIVEAFYHFINCAQVLRWFRKMDPIQQEKLIFGNHALRYSGLDAKRAVKVYGTWFSNAHISVQQIWMAAGAFCNEVGRPDISVELMNAIIGGLPIDEKDLAITYHNLGCYHRCSGHSKLAAGAFNRSRELWAAVGSPMDLVQTLGYYAENSYLDDDVARARAILGEAVAILRKVGDDANKIFAIRHLLNAASSMHEEQVCCELAEMGMKMTEGGGPGPQPASYDYFLDMWLFWTADTASRASMTTPSPPSDFAFHKFDTHSYVPVVFTRDYSEESVGRASAFVKKR